MEHVKELDDLNLFVLVSVIITTDHGAGDHDELWDTL